MGIEHLGCKLVEVMLRDEIDDLKAELQRYKDDDDARKAIDEFPSYVSALEWLLAGTAPPQEVLENVKKTYAYFVAQGILT